MAVVGEAHIIVRAITTSVKDDIRKGFSGVDDVVGKAGKSVARAFRSDFAGEADFARKQWQRLTKVGFSLQTVVGVLAGGIGSLGGALGALAGAAGGAAASLGAVSGILAAFPAAIATAKLAFSGIGEAISAADRSGGGYSKTLREINEELQQLAFDQEEAALSVERAGINLERARENLLRVQDMSTSSRTRREAELEAREAELAYRRALDRRDDLAEQAKTPISRGGGTATEDPFADLLPSQKAFAQFLISLKPLLVELKQASADSFLPELQVQLSRLINEQSAGTTFFEVIRSGLEKVSFALGQAVKGFTDLALTPRNIVAFQTVFDQVTKTIIRFGTILGRSFGAFLQLTVGADKITRRFVGFIESKLTTFDDFLALGNRTGELTKFFDTAGDLAANLGKIFGNLFGFLGDLIASAFEPGSGGQLALFWLEQATASWKNLNDTVGQSTFDAYLLNAVSNTREIGRAFGEVIKIIGKIGSDPVIGRTFQILGSGSEFLEEILRAGAEAGPALAELLKTLTEVVSILAETGAIQIFFKTLNDFAKGLRDVLDNEVARAILGVIGGMTAVFLAVGTVKNIAIFVFKVVAGAILSLVPASAAATAAIGRIQIALTTGPLAIILGVLAGIAVAITLVNARSSQLAQEQLNNARELAATGEQVSAAAMNSALSLESMIKASLGGLGDAIGKTELVTNKTTGYLQYLTTSYRDLIGTAEGFRGLVALLADDTDALAEHANRPFFNEGEVEVVREQFIELGTALGNIAQTNLPHVVEKFRGLQSSLKLTDDDMAGLIAVMGPLEEKIMEVGAANGITLTKQGALNVALGKGQVAAFLLAGGFAGLKKRAAEAKQKVDDLRDGIINFGKESLDARAAERALASAVDSVSEALKQNGKGFDINTESGRANQEVLDSLVKATVASADANFELSGSTVKFREDMLAAREATIKAATELGATEKEARELADTLVGSDFDINVRIETLTQEKADAWMKDFRSKFNIATDRQLTGFDIISRLVPGYPGGQPTGKDGGLMSGGNIRRFYQGGMVSGPGGPRADMIPALLSNGEFVINAASTERYLPLLKAINNQGVGGARLADGGMPGATINMTVNAAPGMDTSEIVNEVSRRIAFQLRSGTS